ncbi:unnamed protein product [Bursaphelenchus okinawaensis]|uniref:PID domain-containing protein n=1 Tax=Bursaphelenchus okinawaensis TaxID=465554 RepID=A0A811LA64_9BILA|nr:unnamed protein product [Bursaphelenchus okinawaensis]CAG9120595.1 unnamed protein product [Bursaphelenchus okinawaensis]
MDRIRRSFRKSLHLGNKNKLTAQDANDMPSASTGSGGKSNAFQPDESSVRNGSCYFQVKYLGSCEVFESRGMEVCEHALKHLRSKNRAVKAVLYVSGDSLRVVDQEANRGLIVDQTVEKVSFCAPDRSNDKGFAYICRDGATKRWMCHGFTATKESGERLSHAVGCSFAICLEKKRKREAEMAVFISAKNLAEEVQNDFNGSRQNQAYSSFRRQLSIAERRQDPQKAILAQPIPVQTQSLTNSLIDVQSPSGEDESSKKPQVNMALFEKQNSFRGPSNVTLPSSNQFRRFNSLRTDLNGKASFGTLKSLHNEPIYEGDEEWPGVSTPQPTTSIIPTSSSVNEFNHILNDSNKENGLNNGWDRSQSAIPQVSNADNWLDDILKKSAASTTSNNNVHYNLADVQKSKPMSSLPPCQPPPPLPPQAVLQTPQRSLFPSDVTTSATTTPRLSTDCQDSIIVQKVHPSLNGLSNNAVNLPPPVLPTPLPSNGSWKATGQGNVSNTLGRNSLINSTTPQMTNLATTSSNPVVFPNTTSQNGNLLNPARRTSADKRKSIEYQILEETDAPPQSPPRLTSPLTQEVDIFGQPVFNPVKLEQNRLDLRSRMASDAKIQNFAASSMNSTNPVTNSVSNSMNQASNFTKLASESLKMNSLSQVPKLDEGQLARIEKEKQESVNEPDPFDVQWTDQVLESARSARVSGLNRNPFSQESAPVNV